MKTQQNIIDSKQQACIKPMQPVYVNSYGYSSLCCCSEEYVTYTILNLELYIPIEYLHAIKKIGINENCN